MAAFLAERTTRIRFGAMFNVLPQWHPLRFAEDFAQAIEQLERFARDIRPGLETAPLAGAVAAST